MTNVDSIEVRPAPHRLLLGFHDVSTSQRALRWAIDVAGETGAELTVVHASAFGVRVCNGPSAAVAHSMGNPTWATVHSVVTGLGAPAGTTTIVEPGPAASVLAKYGAKADTIVLGPRRSRLGLRDLQRTLERRLDVPVLRIDEVHDHLNLPSVSDATGTLDLGRESVDLH